MLESSDLEALSMRRDIQRGEKWQQKSSPRRFDPQRRLTSASGQHYAGFRLPYKREKNGNDYVPMGDGIARGL